MKSKQIENLEQLFSIEGKVAAITGAGGVLFGSIAKGMAGLGAKVAVLDLRLAEAEATVKQIVEAGGDAFAAEIDVLSEESVLKAKQAVLAKYGRIDILINGAGGNHPKA
ncbi:MAG: SDR family NAD(P)-dependent oxidoreductase, partial [Lentisphaerae bacterium]|nr:SDR family NAD(P)-dependent oxidoreductase [Lentisphaerota bacterium]